MLNTLRSTKRSLRRLLDIQLIHFKKPALKGFRSQKDSLEKELNPFFQNYITNVSSDGMAVSLELAAFCLHSARGLKPTSIVDLGSGFSSFVFRYYAKSASHPCIVYSVDDNADWLAKTKLYLESEGLSTENLFLWETFKTNGEKFGLILHDLGNRFVRGAVIKDVLGKASPEAVIILDDFHKHDYVEVASKHLAEAKKKCYSAHNITIDKFGRYSAIVLN